MSKRNNKLIGLVACLLLLLALIPSSYGLRVSACTGGSGGSVSTSGSYELDTSASLNVDTTLGQGAIYQERRTSGSGKNRLKEAVSGNQYSIENAVDSTGQISSSSKTSASNDAGTVDTSTSISGDDGIIESTSSSKSNTVLVAGGFFEGGYLQSDLISSATKRASIEGTASILGEECYNEDVAQFLTYGDSAVSVQGIHQTSDGSLGDFGMLAVNSEHSGMNARRTVVRPPRNKESNGYLFTGWRLANDAGIQMQLAESTVPSNISSQNAATAICTAANTWDAQTRGNLFLGDDNNNVPGGNAAVTTTTYTPTYSNRFSKDNKNTEAWTTGFGKSSSVIAMTMTWYAGKPLIKANNGMYYNQVTESDCWYNAYLPWRIAPGEDSSKGVFDVQTIALHELGHTLGLADLYSSSNSAKTMYGYNDGHSDHTLDQTDINGLVQLYGPK